MKKSLTRAALVLAAAVSLLAPDALSQRRRPSRRATNPVRTQPATGATSGEPSVVSTADDPQEPAPRRTTRRAQRDAPNAQAQGDDARERALSSQVEQWKTQLNQMRNDQRAMYDLERLTRAEQRAEELRRQLREITDKEFQHQERLAEIEYESQSDSIQRRAALVGSLNPSAVREAIAQQLERERARIQKQLELLATSHTRLEAAVASADAEVERLRQRVEAADQQQLLGTPPDAAGSAATTPPQPAPTPTAQPPQ